MKETPTIFTDFLKALGVPHTYGYSAARFAAMPFQSLFGMKKLLGEYGVDSDGYQLPEGADMLGLTPPYIAKSPGGLVIVTGYSPDRTRVEYLSQGVAESIDADEFRRVMPGTVFMAFPGKDSREPDYSLHRRDLFFKMAKRLGLLMCITLIFLYLFISHGIYSHWSTVTLTVLNICGLYFSTLLMQKSLKIHNPAADRVCKVLQEGGCDSVLETKASTFFGIFSWSEVGFTYFSVSLLCLLIYTIYRLSGSVQSLLSAVQLLERMVSEDTRQGVVHALPERPGHSLATLLLLPRRRMAAPHVPDQDRVRNTCADLRRGTPRA